MVNPSGPSIDMTTIRDVPFSGSGQENGPYYFVLKPGVQRDYDFTTTQQPKFQVDPPNNLDCNDLSFTDITSGIGDLAEQFGEKAKSVYETGRQMLGLEDAPDLSQALSRAVPAVVSPPEPPLPPPQGKAYIKSLQTYLQNPSPALQAFLGSAKYTGIIDGIPGSLTQTVISKLESALSQLLKTNAVYGMVSRATPDDIEQGLQRALQFKSQPRIASRDERMIKIAKILLKI